MLVFRTNENKSQRGITPNFGHQAAVWKSSDRTTTIQFGIGEAMHINKALGSKSFSLFCICIMIAVILITPTGPATANENFQITPALNDSWYNPETSGQGYFITVLPKAGIVFMAWFTYDTDQATNIGDAHLGEPNHRWITAQGPYNGNTATLTVYVSSGGQFDTSSPVENRPDGTITLSFDGCNSGLVEYDFASIGKQGSVPIQRVVPDNAEQCENQSTSAVQAAFRPTNSGKDKTRLHTAAEGLITPALNDSWYNPETAGQGYFITVLPKAGIVFMAWFTYDTDQATNIGDARLGEPNHRWITAQGPYNGDSADLTIYISSGGRFDSPATVTNRAAGTIKLSFNGCNSGSVEYSIPSINRQGTVPIQRVVADNDDLCESRLEVDAWNYWQHEDVKTLDEWGETPDEHSDLVALYEKDESNRIALRIDYMNMTSGSVAPTYLGLDFKSGGVNNVINGNNSLKLDVAWDVLIVIEGENITAFDSAFNEVPGALTGLVIDRFVDYVSFDLDKSVLDGWAGGEFSLQALSTNVGKTTLIDATPVGGTHDVSGRAKLVLPFMNAFQSTGPNDISKYDGYWLPSTLQLNKRGGLKYFLDAAEKYGVRVQISDLRVDWLSGNEFLGLLDRFRSMNEQGYLTMLSNMSYGHFMTWWPDVVDHNVINLGLDIKEKMDAPLSEVIYPYEAMLTPGDIEVLKEAGFAAVWGLDRFRYWLGWIEDWSDPEEVEKQIKAPRKIHRINGMDFFFDSMVGNYGGIFADERWEEPNWNEFSHAWLSRGTDQGLHQYLRRQLLDMAGDPDQQQFFTFGTDLGLTEWQFGDVADWNFKWLASHPWIEVTDFDDLISRGWDIIDHGNLPVSRDEHLSQYTSPGNPDYNAYFPQHYYGGIADGHSPLIPEGVEIEALYDYVPVLRDGIQIPSLRIMGDYKTPGSIIYETIKNLESSPPNEITNLAWLSFHHSTGEISFHDGAKLHVSSKYKANFVGHVNKIVAAAQWAEMAATGQLGSVSKINALDLDLDGEIEYTIENDQVFVIFENDGGRVEYAFTYHPDTGPLQLVAPFNQDTLNVKPTEEWQRGEIAVSTQVWGWDALFAENQGLGDEFEYSEMTATISSGTLKFKTGDGRITKEFTLEGDKLTARYSLAGSGYVTPSFGFVTNLRNTYERDWDEALNYININDKEVGWRCIKGGYATVKLEDTSLILAHSFLESPAKQEMRERDDPNSYPFAHWIPYPYGLVLTTSENVGSKFNVSVSLKAK